MIRAFPFLILAGVLAAGPSLAQSSASIGRSAGVVHGQSPMAGSQDLNSYGGGGGRPTTRTQILRQRAAAARGETRPAQQPARPAQRRRTAR